MAKLNFKSLIFLLAVVLVFFFSYLAFPDFKNYFIAQVPQPAQPQLQVQPSISYSGDLLDLSSQIQPEEPGQITEQAPQLNEQDVLDDIQEKLDIIKQKITELQALQGLQQARTDFEQVVEIAEIEESQEKPPEDEPEQKQELEPPAEVLPQVTYTGTGAGGGGGAPAVYPKILISEIQVGSLEDEKQEFVELYNPNDRIVELDNWYLQRKTATGSSWTSYAGKTLFSGKLMAPKGYFLIARQGYYTDSADILTDNAITENNAFALKNPNGEISDKIGFGSAPDYELLATASPGLGQTIGRIFNEDSRRYTDSDNNLDDFELNEPTPKAKNQKWAEPAVAPPPAPRDATPPQIIFNLAPVQVTSPFDLVFTITDLAETTTPSGLAAYAFRFKIDDGEWQEGASQEILGSHLSVDLMETVSASDGQLFAFQVRATDSAGNVSDWLPDPPAQTEIAFPKIIKNILINEVQISPIEQRFVELYNPGDEPADLTGWYLQRKTATADSWSSFVSSTYFNGKIIPAKGFLLISRELPDSDILLNITLSDANSLILKNADREIIDKLGWGAANDFEGAAAIAVPDNQSIERTNFIDTNDNSQDFVILETPSPKK